MKNLSFLLLFGVVILWAAPICTAHLAETVSQSPTTAATVSASDNNDLDGQIDQLWAEIIALAEPAELFDISNFMFGLTNRKEQIKLLTNILNSLKPSVS